LTAEGLDLALTEVETTHLHFEDLDALEVGQGEVVLAAGEAGAEEGDFAREEGQEVEVHLAPALGN